jgi:hypothetical protein
LVYIASRALPAFCQSLSTSESRRSRLAQEVAPMLTPDYPQFDPAEPPPDGSTVSAWRGVLQPFENDAAACSILCDIEQERTLWVSAGSIRSSASNEQHWAHPLLTGMDVACEVMVCAQTDAMPRAYLLSPRFQPYYADTVVHPHPRADHAILHEGQLLPGLCVFSSAELTFRDDIDFYTQFLDQLTQYVAKHLILLRTRHLCRWSGNGVTVLYQPAPGEAIPEQAPSANWCICLPVAFESLTSGRAIGRGRPRALGLRVNIYG